MLCKEFLNKICLSQNINCTMDDVRGFFLRLPHSTTPATVAIKAKSILFVIWAPYICFSQHEAYDILEAAAEENLTGPKYMWLLTSSSVGSVSTFSHKSIPVGTLGTFKFTF